jgi:predicted phosphodiesterase
MTTADDGASPTLNRNPGLAAAAATDWLDGDRGPADFAAGDTFDDLPLREGGPWLMARFEAPAAAGRTRIAVVSDVHLSTRETGSWKVFHRTESRLRRVVADLNDHDLDLVCFSGDLTENGAAPDFELVTDILTDLETPFVAVPGNHDAPKDFDEHEVPSMAEFERLYTPGGLPFHHRVGGVDLVGLNTAHASDGSLDDSHEGTVCTDQRDWLDNTLPDLASPLVVGHHNLPGLLDDTGGRAWRSSFPMREADAFADLLARHDVPLYLSGHLHIPAVAETMGVRELIAPAVCSFPQAYLVLEVDRTGTSVWHVPIGTAEDAAEALRHAHEYKERSRMVAGIVRRQTAAYPLVDDLEAAHPAPPLSAECECD